MKFLIVNTGRNLHTKSLDQSKLQLYRNYLINFDYLYSEDIFGYKNLEIRIAYSETTGHCFVKVRYSEVVNSLGLIPDDIWQKLRPVLPHEYDRDYYEYAERQKTNEVYQKVFGIPKYKFGCQTGDVYENSVKR